MFKLWLNSKIVHRVVYIKCHNFLLCIGVSRFVNTCKWFGFVISLILTLGHIIEHICLGKLDDLVYSSYFTKLNTQLAEITCYFTYTSSVSCFVSNMIEFAFFIVIISELLRLHLNRVRHRPNAAKMHAKKNVITATGHFVSWVIELLLFVGINTYAFSHKDMLDLSMWIFFMLFPSINYAIFPTIQVLTSPDLRHHVFGRKSFQFLNMQLKIWGQHAEEDIELNLVCNGDVARHVWMSI